MGRTLAAAPRAAYAYEPYNPLSPPGIAPGEIDYFYFHPRPEGDAQLVYRIVEAAQGRYPLRSVLAEGSLARRLRRLRNALGMRGSGLRNDFLIVKSPDGLFLAPILHAEAGARVIVLVRHPAAFVASCLRMGWTYGFRRVLNNPSQVQRLSSRTLDLMQRAEGVGRTDRAGMVYRNAVCWLMTHEYIGALEDDYGDRPDWTFQRHEDLSLDPVSGFGELFEFAGLEFTDACRKTIEHETTGRKASPAGDKQHSFVRDSRSVVHVWKSKLSDSEVATIQEVTAPVAGRWYPSSSWDQSEEAHARTD